MIDVNLRSGVPIYKQIMDAIKEKIMNGEWIEDQQIPSIRKLSEALTINPNTIKKSYMLLEQEGFLYSVQGRGSFVAKLGDALVMRQKEEIKSDMRALINKARRLGLSEKDLQEMFNDLYGS